MNLKELSQRISEISEIKIIGKDFNLGTTEYHLIGLCRSSNTLHALFLSFNEELRDLREQAEIEEINRLDSDCEPTVRESERTHLIFDEPILPLHKLVFDDTVLKCGESECSLLSNKTAENIVILSEFIREGWKCERFAHISFDDYYIYDIVFCGEFNRIPDVSDKITLSFRRDSKRTLAEIPLVLKIGTEEKEIDLGKKGKIFIRGTKLVDMYAETEKTLQRKEFRELLSPEEIEKQRKDFEATFSEHCPKGKLYAAVEYESPEGISIDIKLKSVLDSPPVPKSFGLIFFVKSDLTPVHEGMKVKTAVIDFPFDDNTRMLDAEIFSVYCSEKINDIII